MEVISGRGSVAYLVDVLRLEKGQDLFPRIISIRLALP